MESNNPYTPGESRIDPRNSDWYLRRVCLYYRVMGFAILTYVAASIPFAVYATLTEDRMKTGQTLGPPLLFIVLVSFSITMIRTANRLPNDFDRLYGRARWLGILAGSIFFPVLGIPAFIAVRRLAYLVDLRKSE